MSKFFYRFSDLPGQIESVSRSILSFPEEISFGANFDWKQKLVDSNWNKEYSFLLTPSQMFPWKCLLVLALIHSSY